MRVDNATLAKRAQILKKTVFYVGGTAVAVGIVSREFLPPGILRTILTFVAAIGIVAPGLLIGYWNVARTVF